jgi:exosortase A
VPRWRPALVVLGLAVLALEGLFHAETAAAITVWDTSTAYGHCYLVLPIALYLAWERRAAFTGLVPRPVPWLALLALPAAGVWFAADRFGVMEARQFVVLGLFWLLMLSVLGWRLGRVLAVPLAYLVFLVPFGAFLVPMLQDITAHFIDVGLNLFDIPHVVTDTLIEIPEGNFRVATACAGLRFLIAAVAFGALYACVIYRDAGRRLTFIAVSMVVPVLANGVRALGIVLLGHVLGSAEAGAADHIIYGWLFFSAVIAVLLLLGLPFRQDGQAFAPPAEPAAPRAVPWVGRCWGAAVTVLLLAGAGPAAAAWLDHLGQAQSAALSGEAARRIAALAPPPGCAAAPEPVLPGPGVRHFTCDGMTLEARIRLFGPLAGPATLAAWRDATTWASEEDANTVQLDLPGARWHLVSTSDPARSVAAALWLDGRPAPSGLALRRRMALGNDAGAVLVTIAVPAATPAALAFITSLARAHPAP